MDEQPPSGREEEPPRSGSGHVGMGAAIAIGAALGLMVGTMLDSLALGIACGAGLGTVAGAILEGRTRS